MVKFFKYSLFLAAAMLLHLANYAAGDDKSGGEAESENYILIKGSTNINQFQLMNENPEINQEAHTNEDEKPHRDIRISVHEFTASNNRMLKDFQEMLSASEYPYITISIEPRELANFDETSGMTNFKTKISIAGVSRQYEIPCQVISNEDSGYVLKGEKKIELSDFNLDPPEKVFGAIKVNNEVFINFAFQFHSGDILTKK